MTDDAGPLPFGQGAHGPQNGEGLIGGAKQHQPALIGLTKGIKAQHLARPRHLGAQRQAGFVQLNRNPGFGGQFVQRAAVWPARWGRRWGCSPCPRALWPLR